MLGLEWEHDNVDGLSHAFVIVVVMFVSFVALGVAMALMLKEVDRVFVQKNNRLRRISTATSHELKTPLTLMLANLDVLEMENGKDELIDDMREETLHMSRLVAKMVELSRLEEGEFVLERENTNMSKLVNGCLMHFDALVHHRGLSVSTDIESDVYFETSESEMKQVMFILLDNAVKYCDEGGAIGVALKSTGFGHLEIRVENTFTDADPEEFGQFFDRFYRSESTMAVAAGDGSGLSLARLSMRKLGGDVEAYHDPEKGFIGFKLVL